MPTGAPKLSPVNDLATFFTKDLGQPVQTSSGNWNFATNIEDII